MTRVAVIGLGGMGSRMAARLLAAGLEVCGHNRTKSKAKALIADGLAWADSPREAARDAEVVITMVSDDSALAAVTDGPDGLLAGLGADAVYVDMSTVSPPASAALAGRVTALGATMLDAPVSGSLPQAETGKLTVMVGGPADAYARVKAVLGHLGHVVHAGEQGHGLVLKLAINHSLAMQVIAAAESLALAERGGVDRDVVTQVITGSAIASPAVTGRLPLMLDPPADAWFPVTLLHKDVRLAITEAARVGAALPGALTADALLSTAEALGYGGRDIASVYGLLHDHPGEVQTALGSS
ncbi:NAD(P)-dependent oxidoreductase [Conexibacter sp. DBS9H8]|uniref:NAD(P)-dependent oxidoreductase n=1 Tax=Conexibacter sp. DBS9H8 TaxID=2937801 RepID=UPI00200E3CE2|nr:NAD(P)-dependent oxidoreductase [Conexibacter sp. DBS9H8]